MAGSIAYYERLVITRDGNEVAHAGSLEEPIRFPIDGQVSDRILSIIPSGNVILWDKSDPEMDAFKLFRIESSQPLALELVVDVDDEEGTEVLGLVVDSDKPLTLLTDGALADHVVDLAAFVVMKIDVIRAMNDGTDPASVRVIMAN